MTCLEKLTKFFEYYVIAMLTICAILLSILVFQSNFHTNTIRGLTDELSRLELIDYGNE